MARNGSRCTLPHFFEENGLKRFVLILRRLQDVFFGRKCRIGNSRLQKRPFMRVFAHFLACVFCELSVLKFQTSRAEFVISACWVCNLRVLRRKTRRFKPCFAPLCDVCNNSRKIVIWTFMWQNVKRRMVSLGLAFCLSLPASSLFHLFAFYSFTLSYVGMSSTNWQLPLW